MQTITLKDWLKIQCKAREERLKNGAFDKRLPRVECLDGASYSIQASENHFCDPEETLSNGEYETVEVLASSEEPELAVHNRDESDPRLYFNVYVWEMQKVLDKHGGIQYDNN